MGAAMVVAAPAGIRMRHPLIGGAKTRDRARHECSDFNAAVAAGRGHDRRNRRRAAGTLRQPRRHQQRRARAARAYPHLDRERAAGHRRLSGNGCGGGRHRHAVRPSRRARHRVRHRHLARGPCERPVRRGLGRYQPDEAHRRRSSGGSRLRGRAGRHPQGAERAPARPGLVLPHRSRRRRLPRRHGGDARFRHQCRALRDHARQCPRPRRCHCRRRHAQDGAPGAQELGRLRPHPACSSARKARSASSPRSP